MAEPATVAAGAHARAALPAHAPAPCCNGRGGCCAATAQRPLVRPPLRTAHACRLPRGPALAASSPNTSRPRSFLIPLIPPLPRPGAHHPAPAAPSFDSNQMSRPPLPAVARALLRLEEGCSGGQGSSGGGHSASSTAPATAPQPSGAAASSFAPAGSRLHRRRRRWPWQRRARLPGGAMQKGGARLGGWRVWGPVSLLLGCGVMVSRGMLILLIV